MNFFDIINKGLRLNFKQIQIRGNNQVCARIHLEARSNEAEDRTASYNEFRKIKRNLQVKLHKLIHLHDGCLVAASVAVVRSTENCDNITIMRPVVTLHYKLMGTRNSSQTVCMIELF